VWRSLLGARAVEPGQEGTQKVVDSSLRPADGFAPAAGERGPGDAERSGQAREERRAGGGADDEHGGGVVGQAAAGPVGDVGEKDAEEVGGIVDGAAREQVEQALLAELSGVGGGGFEECIGVEQDGVADAESGAELFVAGEFLDAKGEVGDVVRAASGWGAGRGFEAERGP